MQFNKVTTKLLFTFNQNICMRKQLYKSRGESFPEDLRVQQITIDIQK